MPSVDLKRLSRAATELKKHVTKADVNKDGRISEAEVKKYAKTLSTSKKEVQAALLTMTHWAIAETGKKITTASVKGVQGKVSDAMALLKAKDTNKNGKLDTTKELNSAKNLKTFQALSALADSLDINAPGAKLSAADLGKAIAADSKIANYMSESDYSPEFISEPISASTPINEATIMSALHPELMKLFKDDVGIMDPSIHDLRNYLCAKQSPTDAANFLKRLATPDLDGDDVPSAQAFGRIVDQLKGNLKDVQVFTVGPKNETSGKLEDSDGLYGYLVVGRSADGKLAGIMIGSVQT